MKKKKIAALVLTIVLCSALLFCCAKLREPPKSAEPEALCLMLGTRGNSAPVSIARFRDDILQTATNYGRVSVVSVESTPRVVADFVISAPPVRVDNSKLRQLAESNTDEILSVIQTNSAAITPEADCLTALRMSADLLAGSEIENRKLIIADSLLSTDGLMNYNENDLINQTPDAIVSQLQERHAIPDLTDVDVILLGCGQTCGTQPALSPSHRYQHERIVEAILTAGGAKSIRFDPTPLSGEAAEGLPPVSAVSLIVDPLSFPTTEQVTQFPLEPVRLSADVVNFYGDSDKLKDPAAAMEVLRPFADYLLENPEAVIWLAGMTAGNDDGTELSLLRAEAVRGILLEAGANAEQIRCVGLGSTPNTLRVADTDENGQLIEEQAAKNRAVFLFLQDCPIAGELGLS